MEEFDRLSKRQQDRIIHICRENRAGGWAFTDGVNRIKHFLFPIDFPLSHTNEEYLEAYTIARYVTTKLLTEEEER